MGVALGVDPFGVQCWKMFKNSYFAGKGLSFWMGGRFTLIQSTLSGIPTYTFFLSFRIPLAVNNSNERNYEEFLMGKGGQGGGLYLINWEVVSKPPKLGGLALGT